MKALCCKSLETQGKCRGWEAGNLANACSSARKDSLLVAKSFVQCKLAWNGACVPLPAVASYAGSMSLEMSLAASVFRA